MTDAETTAYAEGATAGRDLAKLAGDCPYPIVGESDLRRKWLRGFGDVRPSVSRASDPDHAEGCFKPVPPSPTQAMHEG